MTESKSSCVICGESDTVSHHTNYEQDVTIEVCSRCHGKIHRKDGFYDELAPDRKKPTDFESGMTTTTVRMTDSRRELYEQLKEATEEKTYSRALDAATDFYLGMAGDNPEYPSSALEELMQLAVEQGSVTAPEIAEVLDVDELPVDYSSSWSVGRDE